MRRFGTPLIIDLRAGGSSTTASVTPGTTVQSVAFAAPAIKQVVGTDNYPLARGIMTKVVITLDQAASGGSAMNEDELYRAIDSFNVNVPLLGTTHDKTVFTGPIAKHIAEFTALGYRYVDGSRQQVAAADGDTTLTLYTFLPFTNEVLDSPEQFWLWTGWLRDIEVQINIAASTAIAAASTGAVTKTPCTLSAWIESYICPQLVVPAISQFVKYTTPAATGQNLALLQNVGQSPNGQSAVEQGSRLCAMFELMNVLGLGGASTGDLFTSFACAELGQDQTTNIDGFMESFKSMIGHAGPVSLSAALPIHDRAGDVHTMAGVPNGSLFSATAKFIPWRFMAKEAPLAYAPKINGNINLVRGFTAAPTSGLHTVITNEVRQLQKGKQEELLARAGVPKGTAMFPASSKPLRGEQTFGYGQIVQTRG